MWGTQCHAPGDANKVRFIPTHVGNTIRVLIDASAKTVHPHACGEHYRPGTIYRPGLGSSPRMWGTREGDDPGDVLGRFIPTHVGNTAVSALQGATTLVHP